MMHFRRRLQLGSHLTHPNCSCRRCVAVGDLGAVSAYGGQMRSMVTRRRRLSTSTSGMRRRTLWSLGGLLLILHAPRGGAGRVEISWLHEVHEEIAPSAAVVDEAGDIVACGCQANGFYTVKFSALGEQIWRQEFAADSEVQCATAVASDEAMNVYITGTVLSNALSREVDGEASTRQGDVDIFVVRLSPSGSLVWRHTLGTPYRDIPTSLRVVETASQPTEASLIVGGYSGGSLAQAKASPSNCKAGSPEGDGDGACDAGFVAKLTVEGAVDWIQTIASAVTGEVRVFDLAIDEVATDRGLVVVGETFGDLRHQPSGESTERHAGDVFVRKLDFSTGETQWTTQIGSAASADLCQMPASTASASSYTRVYARGRCAIALHPRTRELSIAATTYGLVSTFPSQKQQYPTVCSSRVCMQLFVARLKINSGNVLWIRQLIHPTATSAEAVVALGGGDDLAVLGTASAGFFGTAESMEQLLVVRIALDGVTQWTAELGLDGEDHATAIGASKATGDSNLFVLSHGSADKTRRGKVSTQTSIRRIHASDGLPVPVCVDVVEFDKTQVINITRERAGATATNTSNARQVQLPVRRDAARLCRGSAASVDYLFRFTSPVAVETVSSSGRVHFASGQSTASVVVAVPVGTSQSATLEVSLQPVVSDTQVNSNRMQWSVGLEEESVTSQGVAAADGHLWRQLTWLTLVGAAIITILMVALGRLGWVGACGSWRKAKIFQYKKLRLRQPSMPAQAMTKAPSTATPVKSKVPVPKRLPAKEAPKEDEDEADELQSHLEEIQQLNQSLGGLLQQHASESTPTTSPRSSVARLPSIPDEAGSPRRKMKKASGWKRSVGSLMASRPVGKTRAGRAVDRE